MWDWFVDLYAGAPLTYQEVLAWTQLTAHAVTGYEAELLVKLSLTTAR